MNARRIASVLAWLLLGVIAYSTLSPLDLRPHMGSSVQIERFGAFGLTGLMFAIAYPRHVLAVLAAMLAAAIGLELTQMLAADRHARLIDLAVKVAGGRLRCRRRLAACQPFARFQPKIAGMNQSANYRG
ncbi:VanZ family protein (plasmid) [Sinorhizobium meliloti]|nr:VanZ family protein [Sinorhizobium meliloti]WKL39780.1 VanZ family protein [Sinorhizobium meliloti]